ATDGPGWNHTLANNLGFAATTSELTDIDKTRCFLTTNYFDMSVTVNSADFLSTDETLLTAPREADGSLPKNNFLKLKAGSDIINAGTDIGFAFKGAAPDLGCFEFDSSLGLKDFTEKKGIFNYPNPFSVETNVVFQNNQNAKLSIELYNMMGMKVMEIPAKTYPNGENTITIKRDGLAAGNYVLVIKGDDSERSSKLITIQ
ncbi:MAG TPA: T9SS type A sorting domain-containing protein, partial [Flavobacterium alvei]|nr:T9SS type A sorting domain-containing protein [Flavobacterium alvei]